MHFHASQTVTKDHLIVCTVALAERYTIISTVSKSHGTVELPAAQLMDKDDTITAHTKSAVFHSLICHLTSRSFIRFTSRHRDFETFETVCIGTKD